MALQNLTIYDVLVHTIPGTLFLIIINMLPPIATFTELVVPGNQFNTTILLTVFILLGYVSGHLLQSLVSSRLFDYTIGKMLVPLCSIVAISTLYNKHLKKITPKKIDPTPFESIIEQNYKKESQIESEFIQQSESYFGIKLTHKVEGQTTFIKSRMELLRWLVISRSFNQGITRADRFMTLRTFFRGLWGVFTINFCLFFAYILITGILCMIGNIHCIGIAHYTSLWVMSVLLFIGAWLSYLRRQRYHNIAAHTLIRDFYTNFLIDNY